MPAPHPGWPGSEQEWEGMGAALAGGAIWILKKLGWGRGNDIKTMLEGVVEDTADIKRSLHELRESMSQQREETEGIRDDMRTHEQNDERRFERIEHAVERRHSANETRFGRLETALNRIANGRGGGSNPT